DTYQLTATTNPAGLTVKWSSTDINAAKVDQTGLVTALSAGGSTIMASVEVGGETKTASCAVLVQAKKIPVTKVTLSEESSTLRVGDTVRLTATVEPSDATNPDVSWSSTKESVAMVDASGVVTAKGAGQATIVAQADGQFAYYSLNVLAETVPVQYINLSPLNHRAKIGESVTFQASVYPESATQKTLSWQLDEPSKGEFTQTSDTGATLRVTGTGLIRVIVSAGGKSRVAEVTVTEAVVPVTSVLLSKNVSELIVDGTERLVATVLPIDATDRTVVWSSTKESVLKVDQTGLVTAISKGENAQIIARAGVRSAVCLYERVEDAIVLAENITLSYSKNPPFKEGDKIQATARVTPSHAHGADNLQWSGNNPTVADVSQTGLVSCKKEGEVVISVTCGTVTRSFQIEIEPLHKLLAVPAYIENNAYKNVIAGYDGLEGGSSFFGEEGVFSIPSHVTHIGSYAFASDRPNTRTFKGKLTVPQLGGVGNFAFLNCAAITSLVLRHGFAGVGAFAGCKGMKGLTLDPEGDFSVLNEFMFSNCEKLETVAISNNRVIHLHNGTFYGCGALKQFPFDLIEHIDPTPHGSSSRSGVFQECGFENVLWNNGVDIPQYTFWENYDLKNLRIMPSSSIHIENSAFGNCGSLRSVYISRNVADIAENALQGCDSPDLVIRIEGQPGRLPGAPWGALRPRIEWL
ncbi:Ig-like domain-containing protein, partial [Porphyromonas loveana]|uniref:Ig-like domain-containing protein n=1 Tax=Porphyromonas loveana TaxID=1884669 RepID=UPI00359F34BE